MLRFVSGVVLALIFLLGGYVLEGGNVGRLLALTPFLITFLVPVFGVLAVWTLGDWGQAWGAAFRPQAPEQALRAAELWRFYEAASYIAGVVALMVAGVLILTNLAAPGMSWPRALSVALVAPVYGGVFGLVARILRFRVEGGAL